MSNTTAGDEGAQGSEESGQAHILSSLSLSEIEQ